MAGNTEKYKSAFVESLAIDESTDFNNLEYNSIEEWDSLGHMALVAELEDQFSITMETDDIVELSSFIKGQEILKKYGVSFD